jgi:hypothetical protein
VDPDSFGVIKGRVSNALLHREPGLSTSISRIS